MVKLTESQLSAGNRIAADPEVMRARKALIMYRSNDPGYALFRTTAANHYCDLVIRNVTRKPLTKPLKTWLQTWVNDPGDIGHAVSDLYYAIERAHMPFKGGL